MPKLSIYVCRDTKDEAKRLKNHVFSYIDTDCFYADFFTVDDEVAEEFFTQIVEIAKEFYKTGNGFDNDIVVSGTLENCVVYDEYDEIAAVDDKERIDLDMWYCSSEHVIQKLFFNADGTEINGCEVILDLSLVDYSL